MSERRPDLRERIRRLADAPDEETDPIFRDFWAAAFVVVMLDLVWPAGIGWLLVVLLGLWSGAQLAREWESWRARRR